MPLCMCVFWVTLDCYKKIQYVLWFNNRYFYSRVCDVQGHASTIYGLVRIYLLACRLSIFFNASSLNSDKKFFYLIIFIRWLNFIIAILPIWTHQNIVTSHRTDLLVQLQWVWVQGLNFGKTHSTVTGTFIT